MKTTLSLTNRVRNVRKEQHLSQEQLAQLAGVSRQTIWEIERGEGNPSVRVALQLCRALQKPLEELFRLA